MNQYASESVISYYILL